MCYNSNIMEINTKKKLVASLSVTSNVILTVLKIAVGCIMGSLSIISEAVHSLGDLFASILTYFSVVKSSQPADADHPYGHGKYEDMAGFIEGILIILAALYIIYKSARQIILGIEVDIENNMGIAVMFVAVVLNFVVSSLLFKVAKESNSISLYADAQHLRTDVYSSLGVLLGLVLIKYTGHTDLDPIIAILVAVFIYRTGYKLSKKAWMNLLDYSLPQQDIEEIKQVVGQVSGVAVLKENSIRARQVGPSKDIDLVLQFPQNTTICECHKICDEIEKQIQKIYVGSSISIHSEPICYGNSCQTPCEKNL